MAIVIIIKVERCTFTIIGRCNSKAGKVSAKV
jgi:hypothetical protein